jgi:hypothetical protein
MTIVVWNLESLENAVSASVSSEITTDRVQGEREEQGNQEVERPPKVSFLVAGTFYRLILK